MGFPDSPDGIPSSIVESTLSNTAALHVLPSSVHTPSMLLDAQKGQPIEVEVIVGEVVRMAKDRGVAVPVSYITPFFVPGNLILTHIFSALSYCTLC